MKRRDFLKTTLILPVAPAIVKAENIMKILVQPEKTIITDPWKIMPNGDIYYVGPLDKKRYTVLELHRWLQKKADESASRNSLLDITDKNPSIKHTDYYIELLNHELDQSAISHLDGGTIKTPKELWSTGPWI